MLLCILGIDAEYTLNGSAGFALGLEINVRIVYLKNLSLFLIIIFVAQEFDQAHLGYDYLAACFDRVQRAAFDKVIGFVLAESQ